MEITYIYHSCFLVEGERCSIVFDYWKDPTSHDNARPRFLDRVDREKPLYVVVSHHHKDHFNPAIFSWQQEYPDVRYIVSKEVARFARHYIDSGSHYKGAKPKPESITILKAGESHDDGTIHVDAFGSTDCGCSWLINDSGGEGKESQPKSIFHAGDLNAWIWIEESTEDEVKKAIGDFRKIIEDIHGKTDRIGYCMFPVDSRIGAHWYMGAEMMVRKIKTDRFFPMHFTLSEGEEEARKRIEDACRFDLYANPTYGEYIALCTPYTSYRNPQ